MLQLPFAGLQSYRDLAQRFGLRQLAEQHGHELSPTAKAARVPLGSLLSHRGFKPIPRDQLENLAEDAAYSFQGEVSPVHWIRSLAELNPNYQRLHLSCCGANLDTSVPVSEIPGAINRYLKLVMVTVTRSAGVPEPARVAMTLEFVRPNIPVPLPLVDP